MNVQELIEKLQEMDPKAIVLKTSSNPELRGSSEELQHLYETTGEKRKETFRDMMDGASYSTEVWSTFSGNTKVVKI